MIGIQHTDPRQQGRQNRLGCAGIAILDLQRDSHAFFGNDGDEHRLGPRFQRHLAAHRMHQFSHLLLAGMDDVGVRMAGGGDTVSALNMAGVAVDFTFVSTAGGAFLEWMEGKTLPGVKALEV